MCLLCAIPVPCSADVRKWLAWNSVPTHPDFPFGDWKLDTDQYWMHVTDHGDRSSPHGWEIDHILPRALGGSDRPCNLRARHWYGNVRAGAAVRGLLDD
ncbi:HNH endonuclease [Azospirillum canadense]|uniref:HNH endonuclease n=1 Tax=Azospirillum canadense TaxID=403962 RepID=UPI0022279CE9|nr:HNH endonuclease [Azospirillum canadense]MCW2242287.1 hypothetical protein [Azospirillum canadense]